jgi:hypothetical protein
MDQLTERDLKMLRDDLYLAITLSGDLLKEWVQCPLDKGLLDVCPVGDAAVTRYDCARGGEGQFS